MAVAEDGTVALTTRIELPAVNDDPYPGGLALSADGKRLYVAQRARRRRSGDEPADRADPSCPTPSAMVADSDLATGRLVDAVSHSKYWSSTAIFEIEDDAQDGPDHVDAHRVLGHVISPYAQTGKVDSTFYTSTSMLRTIELILGLQPLTQFDAAAAPLSASFTDKPDLTPYVAATPERSLTESNQPTAAMARASARMDFSSEDRAPADELNVAIWKSVRGRNSTMPAPRHVLGVGTERDHDGG